MSVILVIRKELDDSFAWPEQLAALSDDEIVGIAREDLSDLVDGATWEVLRDEDSVAPEESR